MKPKFECGIARTNIASERKNFLRTISKNVFDFAASASTSGNQHQHLGVRIHLVETKHHIRRMFLPEFFSSLRHIPGEHRPLEDTKHIYDLHLLLPSVFVWNGTGVHGWKELGA